jgi:mevalonate kinase
MLILFTVHAFLRSSLPAQDALSMHRQHSSEIRGPRNKEYEAESRVAAMGAGEAAVVASAPGKCILFGEHAVVYGQPAVAVAIEQRLTVSLTHAASWSVDGSALNAAKHPHIAHLRNRFLGEDASPMAVHIQGDIPRASGLGSSASLSAAVGAAFAHLRSGEAPVTNDELSEAAHTAEAAAQLGRASPMDTSTSVEGGVVVLSDRREEVGEWAYSRTLTTPEGERRWEVHRIKPPEGEVYLVLGNTGVHAPTSKQVAMVAQTLASNPERMLEIQAIGTVARRGLAALIRGDYEAVGHAMSENHLLLRGLGVSSDELEELIHAALPTSLGVKLTGAGGGGCMVALTRHPKQTSEAIELAGGRTLVSKLGNEGVRLEWR